MKKAMFTYFLPFAAVIALILLFSSDTAFVAGTKQMNNVVKFHVSGCDNCTGLKYCIDGGEWHFVNSCQFGWDECSQGNHSICVECNYDKLGFKEFYCEGTGGVLDVYVTVADSGGQGCNCSDSKK